MYCGRSESASIFCLSWRTYTRRYCASVRSSHSSPSRNLWVSTLPACCTSTRKSSYSLGESFTSRSPTFTIRRTRSTERSPVWNTGRSPCTCSWWRSAAHAGEQLLHAERLGDIVVGAEIERLHFAGLVAAARQHYDRHPLIARAQHSQQFEPLDVGESEIEDDQIGI